MTIHPPPALCFLFFFKVEISLRTLIPFYTPGLVHSGSTSRDDCDRMFPYKLRVSSFPDRVPTLCLDSGIVSPLRLRWIKGVCVFRCNLPPELFAERPGAFTCHCGNTGVERTLNKSQHTKLTLENKFSRGSCRDSNSQPFDHQSGALTNKPSHIHKLCQKMVIILIVLSNSHSF